MVVSLSDSRDQGGEKREGGRETAETVMGHGGPPGGGGVTTSTVEMGTRVSVDQERGPRHSTANRCWIRRPLDHPKPRAPAARSPSSGCSVWANRIDSGRPRVCGATRSRIEHEVPRRLAAVLRDRLDEPDER